MANRDMDSGLIATSTKQVVQYYELVSIGVDTGYYITNAPFDIDYDGNTFQSAGGLLDISNITEDIGFEIQKLSISVSGIAYLANDTEPFMKEILVVDYTDKPVEIYRQYYNIDGSKEDTVMVYKGFIDGAVVTDGLGEGGAVQITTSNHWANFSRITGNYTNTESQQALFAGDTSYDNASEIQKQITWE